MRRRVQRVQKERKPNITVNIIRSPEMIDIDAWCERYVADCLTVLRDVRDVPEAA